VHLVTAVLALGFAAPINTQMTANRAVTGPLIGVNFACPLSSSHRYLLSIILLFYLNTRLRNFAEFTKF
jgi:hypothetical protein